jgi:HEAT repeat protein
VAEEKGELPDSGPAVPRGKPVDRGQGGEVSPGGAAPRIHPRQLATLRQAFATEDIDALGDPGMPTEELGALLDLPDDPADPLLSPAAEKIGRALGEPVLEGDGFARMLELAARVEVPPEVVPQILQRFEKGYLRLLSGGQVRQAAALVERVQHGAEGEGAVAEAFRGTSERMCDRESIEALVASLDEIPDHAFEAAPALIELLGPSAVRHLLDVLARTENRRLRYRLLDLLAKLGPAVARDASALLSDPRWYVVRNMLLLLRRVGDSRSVLAVRRCVDHPDLRVRLEAIHTLFAFDRDVPRELLRRALHDPDLRQAEAAMELAGKYGIAEAVEPIVSYLAAWDPFGKRRAVRLKAIRALAAIGDPAALAGLGRFRSRFALPRPALEERRELFRTLPAYPEASYGSWIESGLRSRDPEIRRLCAAMGPGPGGAS